MMCLPRSASASCSCVIRPESSFRLTALDSPPVPATALAVRLRVAIRRRYRCVDCRNPSPHCGSRVRMSRACLSTKSSGEFDQDRQIRGVRISVHVYLTDKRAAAQVVYVTMRCGIELDEPRNIWGASLPPDDWDETAGLETGH